MLHQESICLFSGMGSINVLRNRTDEGYDSRVTSSGGGVWSDSAHHN